MRTIVAVGFGLFSLQIFAEALRTFRFIRGGDSEPSS
jgi:hypothetical protein